VSSEALYEQYKDALKRGHVASLRGRVDAALLAYAEAALIAPERSTPHTSARSGVVCPGNLGVAHTFTGAFRALHWSPLRRALANMLRPAAFAGRASGS